MGKQNFKALAIFCSKASYPLSPCGACRQIISKFADSSMPVIFSGKDSSNRIETTIGELFPFNVLNELKKEHITKPVQKIITTKPHYSSSFVANCPHAALRSLPLLYRLV